MSEIDENKIEKLGEEIEKHPIFSSTKHESLVEKIKQVFSCEARSHVFPWTTASITILKQIEKDVLKILEGKTVVEKQKLQELQDDVLSYLNDYDIVRFLEQNHIKYGGWLKNQFFKLVGDIRTEIIMKFSKFGVESTKKEG